MCETRAPQAAGAPSPTCPSCLDDSDAAAIMVAFDCGHAACLSCVTRSLGILRDSPHHTARPLACFLGRTLGCNGVLCCAQTRAVLRRIRLHALPAGVSEPAPAPEEAAGQRTPDATDAGSPPVAAPPDPSAALDADAVG